MNKFENIVIVIPSLDPDENLLRLADCLQKCSKYPIFIINDGSAQKYNSIFDELKQSPYVTVLQHAVNCGKGRALKTAFNEFLCKFPEGIGVVTADADGQHKAEDILRCADALAEHPDQFVLGCRNFSGNGIPWKSSFGNKLTGWIFSFFTRRKLNDTQTGLRGIPRDFMKKLLQLPGERFEFETEMLCEAVFLKIQFLQIPIETVYVDSNRATHFNPLQDSFRIYSVLFRRIFRQLFCFSLSGLFSALVDIGLFYFAFHVLLSAMQNQSRWKLAIALVFSRAVSLTVNYSMNRSWVFKSQHGKGKTFLQYLLLCGFVLACAYLLTRGGQLLLPEIEVTWIKTAVDLLLFSISFLIQKSIIFRK